MSAIIRFCELSAVLVLAALCATQPVSANTIKLNNFSTGSGSVNANLIGANWHDGSSITSSHAAVDLGRLFTNHQADIASNGTDRVNKSAFQLPVGDIVNDRSGSFRLDARDITAAGKGQYLAYNNLSQLGNVANDAYTDNIWTMQDMIIGTNVHAKDAVVFAPVPEPQSYAMLLAGLGIIFFTLRRRKQP